jgi:hypothetical protein
MEVWRWHLYVSRGRDLNIMLGFRCFKWFPRDQAHVAPLSEPRANCLAFHSIEAPSPISSSAKDHAPKYALSQTVVDSPVEVVAGKD